VTPIRTFKNLIFRGQTWNSNVNSFFWVIVCPQILLVQQFSCEISNATQRQVFIREHPRHQTAICIHHTNCCILHPLPCTWFMCHFAESQHSDFHYVISSQVSLSCSVCVCVCVVLVCFSIIGLVFLFFSFARFLLSGVWQIVQMTTSCNK